MITFVTLNTIVTDLLNIVRGSQISQSEPISKRQLEAWVHQYRAFLLKRDLDKGKMPNPDYIQEIAGIEMSPVDLIEGFVSLEADERVMKSDLALPSTIDLNHKPGFTYVGTSDGHEIMFVSETRSKWQQYKKYTEKEPLVYLNGGYLYLVGNGNLPKYLTVKGVFEVPTEVSNFTNPVTDSTSAGLDDPYPIPINIVPVLKEMILKQELGIQSQAWSDDKNDADSNMEPNVERGAQAQKQKQD
jgi:hypothetical protein